jgi:preprotein translocase subunit SecY
MGALIIWFTFAYTSITFNPFDLADNLRKSGGFVPGIRPGLQTAEFFDGVLTRICTPGAIYIAILAIIPGWVLYYLSAPVSFSGLSLLIAVGVALDTSSQMESYLIESQYDGFMGKESSRFKRIPRI